MSRRRLLRAGTVGALGLGLGDLLRLRAAASDDISQPRPKAKACIFIFMWGGPSHLDTFDLKPAAPDEIRGSFKAVATSVPGMQFCEHFVQLPRHADKLAVIRSLHHTDPAHLSSGHATLTGHWAPVINSDAEPPSDRDNPHMGSVVASLAGDANRQLPSFVTVPWEVYHPSAPGGHAPGQKGGWLGHRYDPLLVAGDPKTAELRVGELSLPDSITLDRLSSRRSLLGAIDGQRALQDAAAVADMNSFQEQALDLVGSQAAREAFDLAGEPDSVRDRYGRNIHGQAVLLSRRLIERGVPLVSVNWHNDGRNFWDTHGNNFNRLKDDLIPPADQALAALLDDLSERGMLDETIVAWVGEFGRKPHITAGNAGREHWPYCYSGLLAGGGVPGGAIYGASDQHGAYPAVSPVTPLDYAATVYQALGISPETMLADNLGRPRRICGGEPIHELLV